MQIKKLAWRLTVILSVIMVAAAQAIWWSPPVSAQGTEEIWAAGDEDTIGGNNYTPGTGPTAQIFSSPGGSLLQTIAATVDDSGNFWLGPEITVDLVPGQEVQVTDGTVARSLVIQPLTIDSADPTTNIVRGTGPANAQVGVDLGSNNGNGCQGDTFVSAQATTNDQGQWSVDVGTVGGDILPYNISGYAHVRDSDGDFTQTTYHVRSFRVYLLTDEISARYQGWWDPDSSVTVTISDAHGTQLYQGTAQTNRYGEFVLPYQTHGIDLKPGLQVSVADAHQTLSTTLLNISWDSINLKNGVAKGTAPAGTIPCAMGELFVDEPGSDAGKGLWNLDISKKGSWKTNLAVQDMNAPQEVWGNIGWGQTFATYRPADQLVPILSHMVMIITEQGYLSGPRSDVLNQYLFDAQQHLAAGKESQAKKDIKNFVNQVKEYIQHNQLVQDRGDKLIGDAATIINVIK